MKSFSLAVMIATLMTTIPAHAAGTSSIGEQKRDAALKAIRVQSLCERALIDLTYAMPYARKHGISKADAVAKMQTIASDTNKSLVRYMAIQMYYDIDDASKADVKKYCTKQLAKRTQSDIDDTTSLLDGGDALTLFVNY